MEIFMAVIVAIIVLAIYLACPLVGKIALLLVNTVLPDPLPFVDEIIMWIGLLINLSRLMSIAEFIQNHKKMVYTITVMIIILIISVILFFI